MSAASAALHQGYRSVKYVPQQVWGCAIGWVEGLGSPNGIENALGHMIVMGRLGNAQVFKCESSVAVNGRWKRLERSRSMPTF
jgi:hypothetical protein